MKQIKSFKFEHLESRELLAGDLVAGANLIENGEFEDFSNEVNGFVNQADFPSWEVAETVTNDSLRVFEFQGDVTRGHVLNLDATNDFDIVAQDVATRENERYLLSLDFRGNAVQSGADVSTNDIEVLWEGTSLGVFRPEQFWQTIVLEVSGGADPTSRLVICEVQAGNDSFGSFVDDVRLVHIEDAVVGNASFELVNSESSGLQAAADVPSWNSVGTPGNRFLDVVNDPAISEDGDRYLNLDSSAERLDRVHQTFDTIAGRQYYVAFDLRSGGTEVDAFDDEVRIRFNNQFAGVFVGQDNWQSFGFVMTVDSDRTKLVFRESGTNESGVGDGSGPLIDNVRIYSVAPGSDSLLVDLNGGEIGLNSEATFVEDDGPTAITTEFLTVNNSATSELTGAVVGINNLLDTDQEFLAVDTGETGIQSSYDTTTGRLRLFGRSSIENYRSVLRTLTYDNLSDTPDLTNRTIRVSVDYNSAFSITSRVNLAITATNDAPTIEAIADSSVTVNTLHAFDVQATDAEGSDITFTVSATGTAFGTGDPQPSINANGRVTWKPLQSGTAEITVTATDTDGDASTEVYSVDALLNAPVPEDFAPFSGNGQLSNVLPDFRNDLYALIPDMNIDTANTYTATFGTDAGDIEVLLFDDAAPNTVNNFVNLAKDGYYDGLTFHRVLSLVGSETDGFIAQGGDPAGDGTGGPGYRFADEIDPNLDFDRGGLLAMANSGVGTSTNGSQFFFNYDANVQHLNQRHTIFGEISSGIELLDSISEGSVIRTIRIVETTPSA